MQQELQKYLILGTSKQAAIDYLVTHFVPKKSGCWEWVGYIDFHGYGTACFRGQRWKAHRFAYELLRGQVNAETLDHLCCNRKCINPDHVEPVSQSVNAQRGSIKAKQNFCIRGHSLANSIIYTDKQGHSHRNCRTCYKVKQHHYYMTGHVRGAFDNPRSEGGD